MAERAVSLKNDAKQFMSSKLEDGSFVFCTLTLDT